MVPDSKTIKELFAYPETQFTIPNYQRAYSWDVSTDGRLGQVNQFWDDLYDHTFKRSKGLCGAAQEGWGGG